MNIEKYITRAKKDMNLLSEVIRFAEFAAKGITGGTIISADPESRSVTLQVDTIEEAAKIYNDIEAHGSYWVTQVIDGGAVYLKTQISKGEKDYAIASYLSFILNRYDYIKEDDIQFATYDKYGERYEIHVRVKYMQKIDPPNVHEYMLGGKFGYWDMLTSFEEALGLVEKEGK